VWAAVIAGTFPVLDYKGAEVLRKSVASKAIVGILIGCAAIAIAGVVIIIAGGWQRSPINRFPNSSTATG